MAALCALAAYKPHMAIAHSHNHAHPLTRFFFVTEVTQGPLFSVHYVHIKRPPNSHCVFRSGLGDTSKMTAHSKAIAHCPTMISRVIHGGCAPTLWQLAIDNGEQQAYFAYFLLSITWP
jgi:hypothetical protein